MHPCSKEPEPVEEDANSSISLCRTTQFYKGNKCDNVKSGRKRGLLCRHVHYAKHHKTLAEALTQDQNKDIFETAGSSLADAKLDHDQVGVMEMMYYFPRNQTQKPCYMRTTESTVGADIVSGIVLMCPVPIMLLVWCVRHTKASSSLTDTTIQE